MAHPRLASFRCLARLLPRDDFHLAVRWVLPRPSEHTGAILRGFDFDKNESARFEEHGAVEHA